MTTLMPGDQSVIPINMVVRRERWMCRPGAQRIWSGKDGGLTSPSVVGLHCFTVDRRRLILVLLVDSSTSRVWVTVIDSDGNEVYALSLLSNPTDPDVPAEPYCPRRRYSFSSFGRYVYFCNGYGNYYQLEFKSGNSIELRNIPLETGIAPNVLSYVTGNLHPSSIHMFYNQVMASGFIRRRDVTVSSTIDTTGKNPPRELVGLQQNTVWVDGRCAFLGEWNLFRSFPVEDPYGLFYVQESDIIATSWLDTTLVLFCENGVHLVEGIGGDGTYRRRLVSDKVLVGPVAHCAVLGGVLFVARDGIYSITSEGVKSMLPPRLAKAFTEGIPSEEMTMGAGLALARTPFPLRVNQLAASVACVAYDAHSAVLYAALPSNHSSFNNMVWVFDVSSGQWSVFLGRDDITTGTYDAEDERYDSVTTPGNPQMRWGACSFATWVGGSVYWGDMDGGVYTWGHIGAKDDASRDAAAVGYAPCALLFGEVAVADKPVRLQMEPVIVQMSNNRWDYSHDENSFQLTMHIRSSNVGNRMKGTVLSPYETSSRVCTSQGGVSGEILPIGESVFGTAVLSPTDTVNMILQPRLRDDESSRIIADIVLDGGSAPRKIGIRGVTINAKPLSVVSI